MHLQLGELSLVVVSSPRLAKMILKTRDPTFAGRPEGLALKVMFYDGKESKDIACRTYDDYYIQMRRIFVHEMLNLKNVRSLAPVRLAEGKHMISLVRSSVGQSTNMSERISQYTMSVICRASFGRLCKDQDKFVELINKFADLASGLDLGDLFPSFTIVRFLSVLMPKVLKIHGRIDAFLEDMLSDHIKDFASSKGGSDEDMEEYFINNLLKFKDSSSSLNFPFTNTTINPESFIPERFENSNVDYMGNNFELSPFGSGKRICPGMALAIANIELPLALLLHYFDWSLPGSVKLGSLDMSERFGSVSRRKTDLCLIPTLHSTFADLI